MPVIVTKQRTEHGNVPPLPSWLLAGTSSQQRRRAGPSGLRRFICTHMSAGSPLGLGTECSQMPSAARAHATAGPPAFCFVKNGPGLHQTLIRLGLAFALLRPPHRMPTTGCSLLRPGQRRALAWAGLPTPCPSVLTLHTRPGFPHPRLLQGEGLGGSTTHSGKPFLASPN